MKDNAWVCRATSWAFNAKIKERRAWERQGFEFPKNTSLLAGVITSARICEDLESRGAKHNRATVETYPGAIAGVICGIFGDATTFSGTSIYLSRCVLCLVLSRSLSAQKSSKVKQRLAGSQPRISSRVEDGTLVLERYNPLHTVNRFWCLLCTRAKVAQPPLHTYLSLMPATLFDIRGTRGVVSATIIILLRSLRKNQLSLFLLRFETFLSRNYAATKGTVRRYARVLWNTLTIRCRRWRNRITDLGKWRSKSSCSALRRGVLWWTALVSLNIQACNVGFVLLKIAGWNFCNTTYNGIVIISSNRRVLVRRLI